MSVVIPEEVQRVIRAILSTDQACELTRGGTFHLHPTTGPREAYTLSFVLGVRFAVMHITEDDGEYAANNK